MDAQYRRLKVLTSAVQHTPISTAAKQFLVFTPSDFTDELFPQPTSDAIILDTFKAAAKNGISVLSAIPANDLNMQAVFSHSTVTFKLKGDYPSIKQLLAGLLPRYPGLAVQHLNIQRGSEVNAPGASVGGGMVASGSPQQDAVLTLVQWSKAKTVSTQAVRRERPDAP